MAINQIKVTISIARKLSLAAGLSSAIAYFISIISKTWGFEEPGEQIVQTFLAANSVINLYFLGSTSQKISEEKKNESNK